MPRFTALALNRACEELFYACSFFSERVEDSVHAVELECAWCLVDKRRGEIVHGMFKHVGPAAEECILEVV